MSHGKPLSCLRCGAPIPSGFECAACSTPRSSPAMPLHDDPPAEPERSDTPKLVLSGLLALTMVGVLAFGAVSGSASMAREKAEAARKEAAREARWAKRQAEEQARLAQQSQPTPASAPESSVPLPPQAPAAYELPPMPAAYVPPPSAPSPVAPAPQTCTACRGTGSSDEDCGTCDGSGTAECETCFRLAKYSGTGDWSEYTLNKKHCPTCGGTSRPVREFGRLVAYEFSCPKCHGTGRVRAMCGVCHGRGTL